jgi:hypothetical protein
MHAARTQVNGHFVCNRCQQPQHTARNMSSQLEAECDELRRCVAENHRQLVELRANLGRSNEQNALTTSELRRSEEARHTLEKHLRAHELALGNQIGAGTPTHQQRASQTHTPASHHSPNTSKCRAVTGKPRSPDTQNTAANHAHALDTVAVSEESGSTEHCQDGSDAGIMMQGCDAPACSASSIEQVWSACRQALESADPRACVTCEHAFQQIKQLCIDAECRATSLQGSLDASEEARECAEVRWKDAECRAKDLAWRLSKMEEVARALETRALERERHCLDAGRRALAAEKRALESEARASHALLQLHAVCADKCLLQQPHQGVLPLLDVELQPNNPKPNTPAEQSMLEYDLLLDFGRQTSNPHSTGSPAGETFRGSQDRQCAASPIMRNASCTQTVNPQPCVSPHSARLSTQQAADTSDLVPAATASVARSLDTSRSGSLAHNHIMPEKTVERVWEVVAAASADTPKCDALAVCSPHENQGQTQQNESSVNMAARTASCDEDIVGLEQPSGAYCESETRGSVTERRLEQLGASTGELIREMEQRALAAEAKGEKRKREVIKKNKEIRSVDCPLGIAPCLHLVV